MSESKTVQVTAENGVTFTVRRVGKGERYGRDDYMIHDEEMPLIEIYDTRYPQTEHGLLVRRLYMNSIFEQSKKGGIDLHSGEADLRINQDTIQKALVLLIQTDDLHPRTDWRGFSAGKPEAFLKG